MPVQTLDDISQGPQEPTLTPHSQLLPRRGKIEAGPMTPGVDHRTQNGPQPCQNTSSEIERMGLDDRKTND